MLTRLWHLVWRWRRRVVADDDRAAARARFWSEFREGQREAEAHALREG
jgi:hypothetical protein